ncbi:MAG: HAD-IA family hydrolase [Snowella sp.]|nr:HAD-IA family hydrolase [Snowella sp.]
MTPIQSFTDLISPSQTEPPQVIFCDAMGTLFGLRDSVGKIYAQIAQDFDVWVEESALNQAFYTTFKKAPPLAFAQPDAIQLAALEYEWWKTLVAESFDQINALKKFSDFEEFFRVLYDYFATKKPWFVYPDVIDTLQFWQKQKIPLGIISNFDSRLYTVLTQLQLKDFFSTITISSRYKIAKPDIQIFQSALQYYDCSPQQAWHIGDSLKEDYEGAIAAGLQAFLIERC